MGNIIQNQFSLWAHLATSIESPIFHRSMDSLTLGGRARYENPSSDGKNNGSLHADTK